MSKPGLLRQHRSKLLVLPIWGVLIGGYWWYMRRYDLSAVQVVDQAADFFTQHGLGPLVFVLFYAVQPLIFFPTTVLSLAAGAMYGPAGGILITVVAANTAAMVTYTAGRFFGRNVLADDVSAHQPEWWLRYVHRLRQNSFEAVLVMHLIFLPYDLVNYAMGFLQVDWRKFLLGTAMGSLPGTFTFVLFGASFQGSLDGGQVQPNWSTLALSALMLLLSLGLSRYLRRRENAAEER